MLRKTPTTSRAGRRRSPRPLLAFTLVELLVVISIIILLVTMLVPAFSKVRDAVHKAASQKRVNELAMGCVRYANDNKGLYPGQMGFPKTVGGVPFTGSQILAQCLFGLSDADFTTGSGKPTDGNALYAPYSPSDDMITDKGKKCSIWDQYSASNKMPMLYYPSRLGAAPVLGDTNCPFKYIDNAPYTDPAKRSNWLGGSFNGSKGYIADRRVDANISVCNPGTFLIIGAGPDMVYGTFDDVKNFGN